MFFKNLYRRRALVMLSFFILALLALLTIQQSSTTIVESASKAKYEPNLGERLKHTLKCHNRNLDFEKLQYGSFWLLRNIIAGTKSNNVGCAETITYTTNGDFTFFGNLPMVIESWLAPISFALFTPGYDIESTMKSIQYARNCLPERELIRKYVSFHIFFPNKHMPKKIPHSREEVLLWNYNCSAPAPYSNVDRKTMYKTVANLTYPINVGRNIARRAVNTYFIFACDIELIPSPNVPQMFLEMVERNISLIHGNNGLRVFPIPVFEIVSNATVPKTKNDLKAMLKNKTSIPFHESVCGYCHRVPNLTEWLNATESDKLTVTATGKREGRFAYWEPFYISDNREPIFDERVTWEGHSDKLIQNFAMCLLGYEYLVIHPSFLVHAPGIKKKLDPKSPRLKYVQRTNELKYGTIEPEYKVLYGINTKCMI